MRCAPSTAIQTSGTATKTRWTSRSNHRRARHRTRSAARASVPQSRASSAGACSSGYPSGRHGRAPAARLQDDEHGDAKDIMHAVMPRNVARFHSPLTRRQLRTAVVARQTRSHKTDAAKNEQNGSGLRATAVVNHAYETEAKRDDAEAQRDDAGHHDPCVLRVDRGERADVLTPRAIVVLDAPGDQPRHRKEDRSRHRTATQNAPQSVRRHEQISHSPAGSTRLDRVGRDRDAGRRSRCW